MTDLRERTVHASDGVGLHVSVFGEPTERTAVLCLPGLTRNSRDFTDLAAALSARRQVATVDFRGRGRSGYDPAGSSYLPEVYVDDMFAVLHALGIERAVLIGTSLGGAVSMAMAASRPGRVAGIVLNDVGPELDPRGVARIQAYAGKLPPISTWDDAVAQARKVGEVALPGLGDADWLAVAQQQYRETDDGTVVADHDPKVAAGMDAVDPARLPNSWWVFDRLAGIPILVIRGELSDLLAAETVTEMVRRRPDTRTLAVASRGHCPTLNEPECRRAIGDFLDFVDGE
jgi:pimeloyl-ACP methyl ester carboxylesterase